MLGIVLIAIIVIFFSGLMPREENQMKEEILLKNQGFHHYF